MKIGRDISRQFLENFKEFLWNFQTNSEIKIGRDISREFLEGLVNMNMVKGVGTNKKRRKKYRNYDWDTCVENF